MSPTRRRGVGAGAVTATLTLVACSALLPAPDAALPIDRLDAEPRLLDPRDVPNVAVGPIVEVVRGEVSGDPVAMTVYSSADGPCISVNSDNGAGGVSCGLLPGQMPELGPFGVITSTPSAPDAGQTHLEVAGLVSDAVASVWVAMPDGTRARARIFSLEEAEIPGARAFLVFVAPGASPTTVIAFDAEGSELGRQVMGGPGP